MDMEITHISCIWICVLYMMIIDLSIWADFSEDGKLFYLINSVHGWWFVKPPNGLLVLRLQGKMTLDWSFSVIGGGYESLLDTRRQRETSQIA